MAVDVGNNTYSFGRYFECSQQAVLMSGYLGSIGFALPAAMGAWAATQEDDPRFSGRPVVSVSGDGGFGQYMAEILTAVKYNMNITHILLSNNELGKISKEQKLGIGMCGRLPSTIPTSPTMPSLRGQGDSGHAKRRAG